MNYLKSFRILKRDLKGSYCSERTTHHRLDILLYDDVLISTHDLTIPHPRMWQRLFVLEPLKELRPDFLLSTGETYSSAVIFTGESKNTVVYGSKR